MSKQHQSPKIKKFTKKDNICNICQKEGDLSEDHVPPKVCPPVKDRVISKLFYNPIEYKGFQPRYSQNGVSYKTICRECNSKLGRDYDHHLGEFSKKIESFVESNLYIPDSFEVECYPNAIMRSVLGHILTAKTETDEEEFDKLIRTCILDDSVPISEDIHIFYWVYPYEKIVIFRDFRMLSIRGIFDKTTIFNMIKFYPVAFLVTHHLSEYEGLLNLDSFNTLAPQDKATIKIYLRPLKKDTFPECLDSDNVLAFGRSADDSVISFPKLGTKKKARRRWL